jgi:hypothetical protein
MLDVVQLPPPPFDEEKRLVKLGRRVVEAVEGGGEPSVGRSNRRVVSTDEQRNAEYQGGRGIVVQPTGLC